MMKTPTVCPSRVRSACIRPCLHVSPRPRSAIASGKVDREGRGWMSIGPRPSRRLSSHLARWRRLFEAGLRGEELGMRFHGGMVGRKHVAIVNDHLLALHVGDERCGRPDASTPRHYLTSMYLAAFCTWQSEPTRQYA